MTENVILFAKQNLKLRKLIIEKILQFLGSLRIIFGADIQNLKSNISYNVYEKSHCNLGPVQGFSLLVFRK